MPGYDVRILDADGSEVSPGITGEIVLRLPLPPGCLPSLWHDDILQREYYFNDAGRQMDLFGASLRARARGEDVPEGGYQGAYIEDVARALGLDPDAPADEWRARGAAAMVDDIKQTLAAVSGELRPVLPRAIAVRGRLRGTGNRGGARRRPHLREGRRRLAALDRPRRRQGPRARALRRHADVHRRRPGLHRLEARARLRRCRVRPRVRPPRLHRPAQGGRGRARLRPRPDRRAALPVREDRRGRPGGERVQARAARC